MASHAVDAAGDRGGRRLGAWPWRHPDALAAAALLLLPFALLGRALLPGRVLSPADILLVFPPWSVLAPATRMANPLLTDVTFMFHPWLIYAGREIGEGRFPLWNPHAFAGAPFFANPQTALLFPLTWLAYVLPPPLAVTLGSILKLSLAGLGMYGFLRLLALRPPAAVVGALAYMLNGALVTWLMWAVGSGMAMLPWLFAATEYLCQRPGRRSTAALALAVALSVFAGYVQLTALGLLAAGPWALARSRSAERPLGVLIHWGTGAALGLILGAVQLLPFIEYTCQSAVYFYRSQWMPVMAAPARAAIALLMPYYFGSPTGRDFWGYWNFNEITATAGIVPWIVLPAALLGVWRRTGTRFFVGLAAVAAALCYETPGLTGWLGRLPPISLVITFRAAALLVFALAALAALGVEALAGAPPRLLGRLRAGVRVTFVLVVLAALALLVDDAPASQSAPLRVPIALQYVAFLGLLTLGTLAALALLRAAGTEREAARPGRRAPGTLAALVAIELASLLPLAATYNPVMEARLFYPPPPPAVRHVQAAVARDGGRVLFAIGKNLGMLYDLREVTGYDGMTPRRIAELVSPIPVGSFNAVASGSINLTVDQGSPVFDLLGVRHLILPADVDPPAPHFRLEYEGPDGRVWENPHARSRAFLVPRARWCVDDRTALSLMHGGALDFREEVLLAACEGMRPALTASAGTGHARIRLDAAERVVVVTESSAPSWLVLTDTWFPGWRARVDGAERPVLRADHAFRAVAVPPGRHEVELRYEPASFRWGLGLSALGALAVIGALAMPGSRNA